MAARKNDPRPTLAIVLGKCDELERDIALEEANVTLDAAHVAEPAAFLGARPKGMADTDWRNYCREQFRASDAAGADLVKAARDAVVKNTHRVVLIVASGCFPATRAGFPHVANAADWHSVKRYAEKHAEAGHVVTVVDDRWRA